MTYRSIEEKAGSKLTQYELLMQKMSSSLRVSMPAIIKSIDYDRMVVSAQPCIKEKVSNNDGTNNDVSLPIIEDIPLVNLSTSGFTIFVPLTEGDECLLIFADNCIDSWWQSGGIQTQFECRRHDLSDCFAIPTQMSQPKKVSVSNTNSLTIQSNTTGIKIEVKPDTILVNGVDVKSHKHTVLVSGTTYTTSSPI